MPMAAMEQRAIAVLGARHRIGMKTQAQQRSCRLHRPIRASDLLRDVPAAILIRSNGHTRPKSRSFTPDVVSVALLLLTTEAAISRRVEEAVRQRPSCVVAETAAEARPRRLSPTRRRADTEVMLTRRIAVLLSIVTGNPNTQ
jgi:hypothetical protein